MPAFFVVSAFHGVLCVYVCCSVDGLSFCINDIVYGISRILLVALMLFIDSICKVNV